NVRKLPQSIDVVLTVATGDVEAVDPAMAVGHAPYGRLGRLGAAAPEALERIHQRIAEPAPRVARQHLQAGHPAHRPDAAALRVEEPRGISPRHRGAPREDVRHLQGTVRYPAPRDAKDGREV